jgi:3-(3-hydroxy-phenyl)propionate hydroxylase
LLDTYHAERAYAADDNLLNSTRSTDFITPKSATSRVLRDAVLELSHDEAFARQLVNSGRSDDALRGSSLIRPTPMRSRVHGARHQLADAPVANGPAPGC